MRLNTAFIEVTPHLAVTSSRAIGDIEVIQSEGEPVMTRNFDPEPDPAGLPSLGAAIAILIDRDPLAPQRQAWLHLAADQFQHVHKFGDLGDIVPPEKRESVYAPVLVTACNGVKETMAEYAAHIAFHVGGPTQDSIDFVLERESAVWGAYTHALPPRAIADQIQFF